MSEKLEQFDVEAVNKREKQQPLYSARKRIHPKRVIGSFRSFKWLLMGITLGIYYLTPWIRWDRGEFAPDQAVLVDLANRRFYFFFIEIWPQEFYYVAGMLVMAGIALFLVTSTVGRAWCGYSCPQTIWVDLFLVVERYFEGDRNARIKLDAAPWNLSKISKRSAKHIVWLIISIATGGAWIFYFADAPQLARDFVMGDAAFVAYATVGVLAATTYTFGGWMREQVCTYMCPWPRIQAAMLDENSLTVTYNDWRGEPRSRHAKKMKKAGEPVGDCVDCNACVAVCPMGIDIRDGQQLECITCALCIDACDSVMNKIGFEKGLISYATLSSYNQNMMLAGATSESEILPEKVRDKNGKLKSYFVTNSWRTVLRPRTWIYVGLYSAIGLAMLVMLAVRDRMDVIVLHDRNPIFVVLSDNSIRNGYEVKILNMKTVPRSFKLEIEGLEGASMKLAGSNHSIGQSTVFDVKSNQLLAVKIYIRAPRSSLMSENTAFKISVSETIENGERSVYNANFVAPKGVGQ
ncbi:MAG: cytochrome c oxidase accessory protein CcoG [Rhizobiaceae bacterium]|nr:cytochrome c oxidase accessory protein CcoG [Rhizobiaceae bacterium]